MTGKGWSHFRKKVHYEEWPYPYSVISSGGSMPYENAVQNRYSFEESRNLSCAREYRVFQPPFSCSESVAGGWLDSRFAANTLPQPAALPSPSLSPVDSSLLGREPPAESIARFWDRVIRIPTAAKPRGLNSFMQLESLTFA